MQVLNSESADAVRRGYQSSGAITPLARFETVSLAGAFDHFFFAHSLPTAEARSEIESLARSGHHVWRSLVAVQSPDWREDGVDIHGTRRFEVFRIQGKAALSGTGFTIYQERLHRSLQASGFPKAFSLGIVQSFSEMCDNLVCHSSVDPSGGVGMVGYHVEKDAAAFVVADNGRGVLASLRENALWRHLADAAGALEAIVLQRASSRTGLGEGEGFKRLFQALAERNASIRLQTDNAVLIHAAGEDGTIQPVSHSCATLCGFKISVVCALSGKVFEHPLEISLV